MTPTTTVSPTEFANYLRQSSGMPATPTMIRSMARDGLLPGAIRLPNGQYRIPPSATSGVLVRWLGVHLD